MYLHKSARLTNYQNRHLTPYGKIRASHSLYNKSQFNFIQYTCASGISYARIDFIFSLRDNGYCTVTNLEMEHPPAGANFMNTSLFSLMGQSIIPLQNVNCIVHFMPDATLNEKGKLIVENTKFWLNLTASAF